MPPLLPFPTAPPHRACAFPSVCSIPHCVLMSEQSCPSLSWLSLACLAVALPAHDVAMPLGSPNSPPPVSHRDTISPAPSCRQLFGEESVAGRSTGRCRCRCSGAGQLLELGRGLESQICFCAKKDGGSPSHLPSISTTPVSFFFGHHLAHLALRPYPKLGKIS